LLVFDLQPKRDHFRNLYDRVRSYPCRTTATPADSIERICSAVDLACIWYSKEVLCLERSVVTTCLLRDWGVPAQLVLGSQQMPFKAHAWVEVDGQVVNDKPYMPEIYSVLDRC
jgi:hypothetical protein